MRFLRGPTFFTLTSTLLHRLATIPPRLRRGFGVISPMSLWRVAEAVRMWPRITYKEVPRHVGVPG